MTMEFTQSTRPTSDPPRALVTLEHVSDRRSMEAAFQRLGYNVRCTTDLQSVHALLRSFAPDIMIVDSRQVYPQSSTLLLQMRGCPSVLTIAVGADSEDQRIALLRNGIDDAVPTNASPDEVAIRCQAILRRMRQVRSASAIELGRILNFGPLCVDLGRREIRVDQSSIPATRLEFELFAQLCRRPTAQERVGTALGRRHTCRGCALVESASQIRRAELEDPVHADCPRCRIPSCRQHLGSRIEGLGITAHLRHTVAVARHVG
jgi:DNA-binding response OmpR family regulator